MSIQDKTSWKYLRIGLDPEDLELVNQCSGVEKLCVSDVMRRALRDYAKKLLPEQTEKQKVA